MRTLLSGAVIFFVVVMLGMAIFGKPFDPYTHRAFPVVNYQHERTAGEAR